MKTLILAVILLVALNMGENAHATVLKVDEPEVARLARYVEESDRIITGMVVEKDNYTGFEDVWIHVYEPLKHGGDPNIYQAIVRVEVSPAGDKEVNLEIGDEVLLMLKELDVSRGYFGLYGLDGESPPKYPISLKNEVLMLLDPSEKERGFEDGSCPVIDFEGDEFAYCTYDDEEMRFYVPISVTLASVKQEMLKHVSEEYYLQHFDLRRAWDVAVVNGKATPSRQVMEFEYKLGDFRFLYDATARIRDDGLYMQYAPPREISDVAVNAADLDGLVYACLDDGTYYVIYDRVVINHASSGFSPYIYGAGPPEVRSKSGDVLRDIETRFVVWPETGEINCFERQEQYDLPIEREEVFLFDASRYVAGEPIVEEEGDVIWMPLAVIAASSAGVIAIVWYLKRRRE